MKWVFVLGMLSCLGAYASEYRITLGGESLPSNTPYSLRDLGLDDDRAVLKVGSWRLIIDAPGEYHFTASTNQPGRLFQTLGNEVRLVGISFSPRKGREEQDLSDLTPEVMKQLRAVSVQGEPTAEVMELLQQIDPSMVYLEISEPYVGKKGGAMPCYNPKVQFLQTYSAISPNNIDYSMLASCSDLIYLDFGSGARETNADIFNHCSKLKYLDAGGELIHAEKLSVLKDLRYLDLSYSDDLKDPQFLKGMTELRFLSLNGCGEVKDISFVRAMPSLKMLNLHGTQVTDLQPLEKLQSMEQVGASFTGVNQLPGKKMPKLEWLRIMGADLSARKLAAFKKLNPQCWVSSGWNQIFDDSMTGITRLRVRTGGTCHVNVAEETTIFETTDSTEIKTLLNGIEVDEENSGFHCMCCGEPTLEFYQGEALFASIGFHHGKSLRWTDGEWPGDAGLTKKSADFMVAWLDKNGVSGPREEREATEHRQKQEIEDLERMKRLMPLSLVPYFPEDEDELDANTSIGKMHEALVSEYPDQRDRVLRLLEWYGVGRRGWDSFNRYEKAADELLKLYSARNILDATLHLKLSPLEMEGCARYWSRSTDWKVVCFLPEEYRAALLAFSLESSVPKNRRAARYDFGEFQFFRNPDGETIQLTRYRGNQTHVTVPHEYDGAPITELEGTFGYSRVRDRAMKKKGEWLELGSNCTNIVSISIPSSVTKIGPSAFAACANLVDIMVDPSNPEYRSLDGVLYKKSEAEPIYTPSKNKNFKAAE